MIPFICPICHKVYQDGETIIVVGPDRRKHRRGRIAWTRDGICLSCAEKMKAKKEDIKNEHPEEHRPV